MFAGGGNAAGAEEAAFKGARQRHGAYCSQCGAAAPATAGKRFSAAAECIIKETLNNSVSAEQRIFCPIRAVLKMGNTSSIPAFPKLSTEPKSSAVSSYLIIQSFPNS